MWLNAIAFHVPELVDISVLSSHAVRLEMEPVVLDLIGRIVVSSLRQLLRSIYEILCDSPK